LQLTYYTHIVNQHLLPLLLACARSGYSLTKDGLTQLAPLANLSVLSVGACPAISRPALEAFTAAHSRLAMLLQGSCPLLSDEGEALCAMAPEPALASPFLAAIRVN
jgi:hypothetical protein